MRTMRKSAAVLLTLIMLVCLIPAAVFADVKDGWVNGGSEETPYWYYYENGKAVTGWKKIGKKWYFFDESGLMYSGTSVVSGKKAYVLSDSGAMVTKKGWFGTDKGFMTLFTWEKTWFYISGSDGAAYTGWKKLGGKWYYFFPVSEGTHIAGTMNSVPALEISKKIYVFNTNGTLVTKTGWVKQTLLGYDFWFYVKKGGIATTGWKKLSGNWFYFSPKNGVMACEATVEIDDLFYDFDENGVCTTPNGYQKAIE